MNDIFPLLEELKEMIIDLDEYKEYKKYEKILQDNKPIKKVIDEIKEKQKIITNKEVKNIDKEKEEFEVQNLFRKLKSYKEYNDYVKASRNLNILLTNIKSNFEDYFNKLIID